MGAKYAEEWDPRDPKMLMHILRNPGDMFVPEEPTPPFLVHAKRLGGWINPNLLSICLDTCWDFGGCPVQSQDMDLMILVCPS